MEQVQKTERNLTMFLNPTQRQKRPREWGDLVANLVQNENELQFHENDPKQDIQSVEKVQKTERNLKMFLNPTQRLKRPREWGDLVIDLVQNKNGQHDREKEPNGGGRHLEPVQNIETDLRICLDRLLSGNGQDKGGGGVSRSNLCKMKTRKKAQSRRKESGAGTEN